MRWQVKTGVVCLLLAVASWVAVHESAKAQSIGSPGIIEEIRVEGTQRIEPETVRSYMKVNPGDPFDALLLDESLKALFATGLFADVTLRREGDALIVTVVENPIINRIAFEGNRRIDDETLEVETSLRPRVVFTRTKVQNDVQRILELYRAAGRFGAMVEPKVIQLDQNRVDLVFEINEGPATEIKSINFIGNRAFSDGRLREEITTSESAFWRFLSTTDTYDPDRLTFDRELLRRFYLSEGYADFRVISAVAELTPDREGFIITFTIEEGPRYEFGKIDIRTTLPNLDPVSLRDQITTEEGDWYDAEEVEETISNLTEAVGDLGYAFVDIRPSAERDREALTIDVTYAIEEGPKVYVERIDIEGNVRTEDEVIRREFTLDEGDAFNASKLRRARRQLENLGFFRSVDITNQPGTQPDRTVVKVDVEEQSTGNLSFGAGFSSTAGPIGSVTINERNLLGRGQDLRLNFIIAGQFTQVDLGFTEPYFLDRNLAAGFDLFRVTEAQDDLAFEEEQIGGSLRAGYNLQEDLRQLWRYTLKRQTIDNVDEDASPFIQDEEGSVVQSSLSQDLTYDTLDNRLDPREGLVAGMTNEVSGLGGDSRFLKNTLRAGYYYPLSDELTGSVRASVGNVVGLGQDTSLFDRFFTAGEGVRGFERAGIGPRDAVTGDALGGDNFYISTVELSFPLGLPEDLQIRGRVFTDVGAVFGFDEGDSRVDDSSSPRVSVGTGISWVSPFGPVIVDLGFAIIKEDFDQTEILRFSFGTSF